jgi:hypothetical protein
MGASEFKTEGVSPAGGGASTQHATAPRATVWHFYPPRGSDHYGHCGITLAGARLADPVMHVIPVPNRVW